MCVLIFVAAGCTKALLQKKYLGKPLPPKFSKQLRPLHDKGHHFFHWPQMDITYDYRVETEARSITFEGTMQYNLSTDESRWKSETVLLRYKTCVIIFLFANADQTVTAVEVKDLPVGRRILDPLPFQVTVPYDPAYAFVVTSFSAYAEGV